MEVALDDVADLAQAELQVELDPVEGRGQRFGQQAGQVERAGIVVLPVEQDLEQRGVLQLSWRIDPLDDLLEGNVLVVLGAQGGGAHAFEQATDGRLAGQVDAQRQGVDEEADQRLDLLPAAVGRRSADDHLVLAGQARQHGGPGGGQGHEQGGVVLLAEAFECAGQRGIECDRHAGAGMGGRGRARPVGRQGKQDRRIGQAA
ncbi:hypothetical protein GGR71_001781, partial [Xanthomonas sp. F1]